MIRVTDRETGMRMLIRDTKKGVKDLAFAYIRTEVVLGVIDGSGMTYIFKIEKEQNNLLYPFFLFCV